jgi:transcriptional regulator with XRE-family HTH domain
MRGRPAGRLIHAEAFEALLAARGWLKRAVADQAGVTPGFLADLLAHRRGASPDVVARLAAVFEVPPAALFPEIVGWVAPLPDRQGVRGER